LIKNLKIQEVKRNERPQLLRFTFLFQNLKHFLLPEDLNASLQLEVQFSI